jgi:DNA replication protein DnaC
MSDDTTNSTKNDRLVPFLDEPDEAKRIQREEYYRSCEQARRETERREEQLRLADRLRNAKLPARHAQKKIDVEAMGDHPWAKTYRSIIARLGSNPDVTILLLGPSGPGKTQVAVEATRWWCAEQKASALYTTAEDAIVGIRDAMKDKYSTETKSIGSLTSVGLLVVDECDKRYGTKWGDAKFTRILDTRYRDMKPTILIANVLPKTFSESVGPSITDRIRETGVIIECTWASFRRTGK